MTKFFLVLAVATPVVLRAQEGRAPDPAHPGYTPHEWLDLRSAEFPAISPDGSMVVYRIINTDVDRKTNDSQLWISSVSTGVQRQLTTGPGHTWAAAWSPDGKAIAFLGSRDKGTQVYLVPSDGGEPQQITNASDGVDGFRWSPDGKRIAYTSGEAVPRPDSAGVAQRSKDFRVLGREGWYSASLWVVTVPTAGAVDQPIPSRLTKATDFAPDDAISWSPDGSRIAFTASDYTSPESFWTYDLYVVSLADQRVRKVVADRGPQFYPLFSPDGREIAFRTYVKAPGDDYHIYSIGYVATVPAEGGPTRVLTGEFDENVTPIAWAPEGIYFEARQGASSHLFRVTPATRAVERISQPNSSIKTSFSFSRDFRQVAFLGQDSARYQEVYAAALVGTARPNASPAWAISCAVGPSPRAS